MDYKSEQEIVIGCQKRQAKAQTALYNLYKGRLLGVCMRYCRTLAEAEDVFQEAFVKIFLKIENLQKIESIASWVKTIVINTATDHYRKNLKYNNLTETFAGEIEEEESEDLELEELERNQVLALINQMPTGYRLVINMFFIDGFSHQKISAQLGISVSTSKTQLFHAKAWLKNKINKLKVEA
jgi:RNA polymerase sigma factor (sigma-70 family)